MTQFVVIFPTVLTIAKASEKQYVYYTVHWQQYCESLCSSSFISFGQFGLFPRRPFFIIIMGQFSMKYGWEKHTQQQVLLNKQVARKLSFCNFFFGNEACSWLSMVDSINWCINWTTNRTWTLHSWGQNRIFFHSRIEWHKKCQLQ